MRRILVGLLIAFLAGCSSGGGDEGSSGGGTDACGLLGLQTKIIGGDSCGSLAQAPVVRIVAYLADGTTSGICTGTMLTQEWVLTATHCFNHTSLGGVQIITYGIETGDAGSSRVITANDGSVAPNLYVSNGRIFNDAALLHLSRPAGLGTLAVLASRDPLIGEAGYVYGYGLRQAGTNLDGGDDFRTLEGGIMEIANVTPNHIFSGYSGAGVNVCFGDSGGPIVVDVDGSPAVAGVVSMGTDEGCRAGDITTFINLQTPEVFNWLTATVPGLEVR